MVIPYIGKHLNIVPDNILMKIKYHIPHIDNLQIHLQPHFSILQSILVSISSESIIFLTVGFAIGGFVSFSSEPMASVYFSVNLYYKPNVFNDIRQSHLEASSPQSI